MASEKIDALELDITSKSSTENIDKLIEALGKLSTALGKIQSKKVSVDIQQTGSASKTAADSVDKLTSSFFNQAVRITALIAVLKKLYNVISDGIANSATYIKTLNMFNTSLGQYADNATKYGETVSQALGIDIAGWQDTQGIFDTLIKGMGVASDKAAYMSQNLTQLAYDISSYYGITLTEAANKLKSAMGGRVQPVRQIGYSIEQSRAVDYAKNPANYGKQTFSINQQTGAIEANTIALDKNTQHRLVNYNQMTSDQKAIITYNLLLSENTQIQGNFARALNDPYNQMRIFKDQLNMTSRAFGNMFIPALNKVLPYLSAFAQLATEAFQSLAQLFGFELPDMKDRAKIDTKPYDHVVKATGKAAKNTKKMKDYMLGIDELNVFNPNTGAGAGGGSGAKGQQSNLNNMRLRGYDFLGKAVESSIKKAKENIEKLFADLKKNPLLLNDIIVLGAGELGSKIWEKILGKTPEQLKAEAAEHGRTVGEEFIVQLAYKIKGGVEDFQTNFWTWVFGKSPEELAADADQRGVSVGTAFWGAFFEKLPGLSDSAVKSVPFMDALFGNPESLAKRATEAGRTVGEQFFLELGKMANQYLKTQPILKFFYEKLSGRSVDADIAALDKVIKSKSTPKTPRQESSKGYVSSNEAKRLYEMQSSRKQRDLENKYNLKLNVVGNTSADEARKAGERYAKNYAGGLESGKPAVNSSANGLFKSGYNGINANGTGESKYKYVSADQAKAYYSNLGTKADKTTAYNNSKALAVAGNKGANSVVKDYIKTGENSSLGYIKGIAKHIAKAGQKGADLGAAALKALKKELKTNSPSKAFAEVGMYSAQGYANAVDKYSYLASDATTNMATKALSAMTDASDLSNMIINGTIADPMASRKVNMPSTTGVGYGVGMANADAMASMASSVYQAVVSGMSIVADSINDRDVNVLIDGKAVFKTVQTESRKRGVAISNGTFGR